MALGAGEVLARLLAFGATVFLARTLGAASFGVIGFATAVLLYFSYVAECGIDSIGVREVARAPLRLPHIMAPLLMARLAVAGALTLLIAGAGLLLLPQPDGAVLAVYALTLPFVALNPRWVLLGLERGRTVALSRTAGEATALVLVLLLVRQPDDLTLVPLAQVVGLAIGAGWLLVSLRRVEHALTVSTDWVLTRAVFGESWQLVGNSLFALFIFNANLIFLRIFREPSTVGHFAAAFTLISFLANLGVAYGQSLLPALTRQLATPEHGGHQAAVLYRSAMLQLFAGTLPLAVGGAMLASGIIIHIFGIHFVAAAAPLAILVWSVIPAVWRNVPQAGLIALSRQSEVLRIAAITAVVNLLLNLALIPEHGMIGAAIATLASETLRFGLTARAASLAGLEFGSPGQLLRPVLAVALMASVVLLARPLGLWPAVGIGAVTYGAGLVALRVVDVRGLVLALRGQGQNA